MSALAVEVAGRFVGEQDERAGDDGAGDGDALLLAAGEFGRRVVLPAGQADHRQRLARRGVAVLGVFTAIEQRQLDVLLRRSPGEQIETLENEAEVVAAQERALVARELVDAHIPEDVGAGGRRVEAAEDVECRRFARTARSHDGHEFALADGEIDAA